MRTPLSYSAKLPQEYETLSKLTYEEIWRQIKKTPGRFPSPLLYKYLSSEISNEILSDYLLDPFLWLSSPKDFNDPFDMSAEITTGKSIAALRNRLLNSIKRDKPWVKWKDRNKMVSNVMSDPEKHFKVIKSSFKTNIEKIGVFCFSEDNSNLLMWSHYANHHKGFVLQFDIAYDLQTLIPINKVEYSIEYPLLDWSNLTVNDTAIACTIKHVGWSYEKEWRMIEPEGAKTYLQFKPEAVTRLIFGCRVEDEFKNRILNILQQREASNLPPLNINCAVMHDKNYELK